VINLYQRYQHLSLDVLASTYGNLFLVTAALTATGAVLALFLRVKRVSAG
jgi:hypothetical protein